VDILNRPEYKMADKNMARTIETLSAYRKKGGLIERPLSIATGISLDDIARFTGDFSMQVIGVLKEAEWKFGKKTRARMALQLLETHGLELSQLYFRYKYDQFEPHFGGDHLTNCLKSLSDPSIEIDDALAQFTTGIETLKTEIRKNNNLIMPLEILSH
jgi:hypothetical protein